QIRKPEDTIAVGSEQDDANPFEKIMHGKILLGLTPEQLEERFLSLLKAENPKLHTMYQNYIKWYDYTIRKWSIWFSFPDTSIFSDVINRIRPDKERSEENENDPDQE